MLHLATKLNSRDIKKCIVFREPSYDLFASARKAVFSALTATGVHRMRNTWSSLSEVICHKKVQQSFFLHQILDPPIKNSWIRPYKNLTWGFKIGCKCPTPGQHQNCIFQMLQTRKGWAILFLRGGGGGGLGNFCVVRIFFFAFGLCTNFF